MISGFLVYKIVYGNTHSSGISVGHNQADGQASINDVHDGFCNVGHLIKEFTSPFTVSVFKFETELLCSFNDFTSLFFMSQKFFG